MDTLIEAHEERCWSLTQLNPGDENDQSMITCGADGKVVVWADISEEIWEEGNYISDSGFSLISRFLARILTHGRSANSHDGKHQKVIRISCAI